MALETSLRGLGLYLAERLEFNKANIIVDEKGASPLPAFNQAVYGEPRVITKWPLLSVQPPQKLRELKGTRKFDLQFQIWLVLYHGSVASTLDLQAQAHARIEAIESYIQTSQKFNYIDATDVTQDKVIFGWSSFLDHPVILAPDQELWTASRIQLQAMSEEVF